MGSQSKYLTSVPYNCYEVAHPWTESCSFSWAYLFASCVRESGRIYSILYLFSQLVLARKYSPKAFMQTLSSATRSTLFLSYNVFYFLFFICILRRVEGEFYLPQISFTSGFISSYLAILVERPSRRPALTLYMFNIASEVVFNMLARRNLVPVIPYGDVLLFCLGMAGHTFLLDDLSGRDPISSGLKFFIGEDEFQSRTASTFHQSNMNSLLNGVKRSVKAFLIGYLGRCLISTATALPKIIANPSGSGTLLRTIFASMNHLKQGVFLGGAVASFRIMRWLFKGLDQRLSRALAGAVAGLWIITSRNKSLTLYLFWKSIEIPFATEIIYALSTALVLFNAVMEPLNVRPSYLRFLSDITGTALERVNRHPVSMMGYASTEYRPNFFPYNIDLSKVHPKFIEMVAIWS